MRNILALVNFFEMGFSGVHDRQVGEVHPVLGPSIVGCPGLSTSRTRGKRSLTPMNPSTMDARERNYGILFAFRHPRLRQSLDDELLQMSWIRAAKVSHGLLKSHGWPCSSASPRSHWL